MTSELRPAPLLKRAGAELADLIVTLAATLVSIGFSLVALAFVFAAFATDDTQYFVGAGLSLLVGLLIDKWSDSR